MNKLHWKKTCKNVPAKSLGYSLRDVDLLCDPADDPSVHVALAGHWVRGCHGDVGRLLEEGDPQVELLRHALRRRVGVARPDDVLDVQTLALPGLPDADLEQKMCTLVIFRLILQKAEVTRGVTEKVAIREL